MLQHREKQQMAGDGTAIHEHLFQQPAQSHPGRAVPLTQ